MKLKKQNATSNQDKLLMMIDGDGKHKSNNPTELMMNPNLDPYLLQSMGLGNIQLFA